MIIESDIDQGYISMNINPISFGQIPKLLQCVYFYNLIKLVYLNHSCLVVAYKFNSVNDNVSETMSSFDKNRRHVG